MKNLIVLAALLLSALTSLPGNAQASTDVWRLIKKTWLLPGDAPDIYEYKYDAAGRIVEIKNLSGKTLKNTEKDFVYDSQGKISRSSLFIKGAKLYTYEFLYDGKGRLSRRTEIKHDVHSGRPDKVTRTRNFRYENNRIVETGGQSSFGGKLQDETVYSLDDDGNFLRHTSNATGSQKQFNYGAHTYQNKPALMAYTGAYFSTDLKSPHLHDEGSWEGDGVVGTQYSFNANGLVSKQIITYTTSDGMKYPHTYHYAYVKIK